MNKKEMAGKLAKNTGLSVAKAGEVINEIFSADSGKGIIAVELDGGHKVTIPGFGTFDTKTRAARMGTNPATGAKIQIPRKSYVTFKPGKTLRDRVAV